MVTTLIKRPHRLCEDRSAVTMLEYAIMGSLIAAVLVTGVPLITSDIQPVFQAMADKIPAR